MRCQCVGAYPVPLREQIRPGLRELIETYGSIPDDHS
jgi:hypothetical protein